MNGCNKRVNHIHDLYNLNIDKKIKNNNDITYISAGTGYVVEETTSLQASQLNLLRMSGLEMVMI